MDTFGGNQGTPVPQAPSNQPGANQNFAMQTPGMMGTPPALNAKFNQPPQGSVEAPAVVTAEAATDHVNDMTHNTNTALTDTQNLALHNVGKAFAANNPPDTTDTAKTDTTSADPSATGNAQIDAILSSLSDNESSTAAPSAADQAIIDEDNAQIEADNAASKQVGSSIDQMNSGTFPLTPAEQLQVTGVGNAYGAAVNAAKQYAINLNMGAVVQGAKTGMQMYSPATALSTIQNAINAGAQKVNDINTRMSNAMTKLTVALQNSDYKTATQLYKSISDDIKLRTDEVGKINTSVENATKQMYTDALNVAKEQIAGVKLDLTQKQNTINNLYKQGTLNEKQRHDLQTEAVTSAREQRLAAAGSPMSGGGKPVKSGAHTFTVGEVAQIGAYLNQGGTINGQEYAGRGADGYIDPGVYEALANDWQGKGGTLKDFISQYPPKYYINPGAQVPLWMSTAPKTATNSTTL